MSAELRQLTVYRFNTCLTDSIYFTNHFNGHFLQHTKYLALKVKSSAPAASSRQRTKQREKEGDKALQRRVLSDVPAAAATQVSRCAGRGDSPGPAPGRGSSGLTASSGPVRSAGSRGGAAQGCAAGRAQLPLPAGHRGELCPGRAAQPLRTEPLLQHGRQWH